MRIAAIPERFGAAPPRGAGILVARTTPARRIDDDFVRRIDIEDCRIHAMSLAEAPLDADFRRAARRGLQREVEPGPAAAVGDFGKRGRLEPFTIARIEIEVASHVEHDAHY